jgi:CDGSH-type Zn-finger protein
MPEITVRENGPYVVTDAPAITRRRILANDAGESTEWETHAELDTPPTAFLCRCGGSSNKPFCDSSHATNGIEAEDVAFGTYDERSKVLGHTEVTVRDDRSICVHAAFCTNAVTNVWKLMKSEPADLSAVTAMIDKCPSGALTYSTESLLEPGIAAVDDGPLYVTGAIPVTGIEARNRMTLCRCGHSATKPLCDGSHKEAGFRDA